MLIMIVHIYNRIHTSVAESLAAFSAWMDVSNAVFVIFGASSVACAPKTDADTAFARGSRSATVATSASNTNMWKNLVGRFGV